VVDARFDEHLPDVREVLEANDGQVRMEVMAHLDGHTVRAIALTPTGGLQRGSQVHATGSPIRVPVGREVLGRMFDVFGKPIDGGEALDQLDRKRPPELVAWPLKIDGKEAP
jgi:F-type H+-transporting ATPase subunit beta